MPSGRISFPNIRAFYADDPRRDHSGELDYGVMWTARGRSDPHAMLAPTFRVSFIRDTREFYAHGNRNHDVVLIGALPDPMWGNVPDVVHHRRPGRNDLAKADPYDIADAVMDGWVDHIVTGGIDWVRSRIARVGGELYVVASTPADPAATYPQ